MEVSSYQFPIWAQQCPSIEGIVFFYDRTLVILYWVSNLIMQTATLVWLRCRDRMQPGYPPKQLILEATGKQNYKVFI